jgi:hypothetical protein
MKRFAVAARPRPEVTAVAVFALFAAALYVLHPPAAPDLAAQVARVDAARSGAFLWWTGWFGGLQLPAYSALAPIIMAWMGVAAAAALAALGVSGLGFSLFREARRPIAGVAVLSIAAFADIFAGRVTFALGAAAAVASIVLIRRQATIFAVLVGCLSFLLAPLAGLFLGLCALAVAIAEPERRRAAGAVSIALLGAGAVQVLAFPGGGEMPYPWLHMVIALIMITAVAIVCPSRTIRTGCAVVGAATILFYLVPSPVGTNVVRMSWLVCAPVVAACARLKRVPAVLLVAALAVWPALDLGIQLSRADSPASQASFFTPLVTAWRAQAAAAGSQAGGERVELVDPASQWGAAYVAPEVPIARGWDRPTDRADNALFYDGTLTSASYDSWLHEMSVGWVALPIGVSLDYASKAEAAIVQQQPAYLRPVWHNASWQLYRVIDAQPIVTGATLIESNERGITFHAAKAGTVDLKVRYSPYLQLSTDRVKVPACVTNGQPWTHVTVTSPGTYTLGARFATKSGHHPTTCVSL